MFYLHISAKDLEAKAAKRLGGGKGGGETALYNQKCWHKSMGV